MDLTVIKQLDTLFYSRNRWQNPLEAFRTNPQGWKQMYCTNPLYLKFQDKLDNLKNRNFFETELIPKEIIGRKG